jgi:hypothetical protein
LREKKCRAGQQRSVEESRSAKQCQTSSAGLDFTPMMFPGAIALDRHGRTEGQVQHARGVTGL